VPVLLAAAVGCSSSGKTAGPDESTDKLTLALASPSVLSYYSYRDAEELGYFEDEGLDVKIVLLEGPALVTQAIASGAADLTDNVTTGVLGAVAASRFEPVMVYRTWYKPLFGVYAPTSSNINVADDLRGKTIGVGAVNDATAVAARQLAAGAGLKDGEDYKLLAVRTNANAVAAFSQGQIDAWAGGPADIATVQAAGIDLESVETTSGEPTSVGAGLWSTKETLGKKGEAVRKFIRGYRNAVADLHGDVDKVFETAGKIAPEQVEDEKVAKALIELTFSLTTVPEGEAPGMIEPAVFEQWWTVANKAGQSKIPGSPEDYYTNEFVPGS